MKLNYLHMLMMQIIHQLKSISLKSVFWTCSRFPRFTLGTQRNVLDWSKEVSCYAPEDRRCKFVNIESTAIGKLGLGIINSYVKDLIKTFVGVSGNQKR